MVYDLNLFPQYAPSKKCEAFVHAYLNLLIDKKLFAQEGRKRGFDKTPHVKKVIDWVKRDEMLRDEFLAKEAERRGLDKDARVQSEVKKWNDEFTFSEYWNAVRDTIKVTDAEKQNYFSQHQGRYLSPEKVNVAEILLATKKRCRQITSKPKIVLQQMSFPQNRTACIISCVMHCGPGQEFRSMKI